MGNILVIDDDESYADVMRAFLMHRGHTVRWAADGVSGLVQLKTQPPDLIILDNWMPGGKGSELFSFLDISSGSEMLPVLFVTASPMEEIQAQVGWSSRVRFLPKPVDFRKLETMIGELLPA